MRSVSPSVEKKSGKERIRVRRGCRKKAEKERSRFNKELVLAGFTTQKLLERRP